MPFRFNLNTTNKKKYFIQRDCALTNFQPSNTPPGHELKVFSYDFSYDSADKDRPTFASQEKVFIWCLRFHIFTQIKILFSFPIDL